MSFNVFLVAISVPGYLQIPDLSDFVVLEGSIHGKGSTAEIVKGTLKYPPKTQVAVKFIDPKETSVDLFRYEVSIMGKLPKSHPNLVQILGFSEEPRRCIVMKFYPYSLRTLLNSVLSERTLGIRYAILSDIASGMHAIHSKHIIHFDLKPGNILIEIQEDGSFTCRICDFGYAKFQLDSGNLQLVAGMKTPKVNGLTIRYAAPEVNQKMLTIPIILNC